jgi:HEAT repeat protein
MVLGAVCWFDGSPAAAQDEPNEALIEMVTTLVSDADRDMRALGLQQIREEVPGEAATKKFAELLPKLAPEGQAELLGALGDRGDAAAKPAVMAMLESEQAAVRAAALGALGALGGAGDVPLLAKGTAAGSDAEKAAARMALVRLRGEGVNAVLINTMGDAKPEVQAALLGVLAGRNAKEAVPQALGCAEEAEDAAVRLAALAALRYLADVDRTGALASLVKEAKSNAEREKAKLALLAVCSRGGEQCAEPIIGELRFAKPVEAIPLLSALARAGGAEALKKITELATSDQVDGSVRDEAVRMISRWPDREAVATLQEIARTTDSQRHKVLAIRGVVRLTSQDDPPQLDVLEGALKLAPRPVEKRLVLGALGNLGTPEALALVTPLLTDAALAEEAALAAIAVAERIKGDAAAQAREALEKVLAGPASQETRKQAQKVLDSM